MASRLTTVARRAPSYARQFSAEASGLSDFAAKRLAVKQHAADTSGLWKKVSFYGCLPAIAIFGAYIYKVEADHAKHVEHLKHENGGEYPHANCPYMNKRDKPFPWGMNSLFFNKEVNRDMSIKSE